MSHYFIVDGIIHQQSSLKVLVVVNTLILVFLFFKYYASRIQSEFIILNLHNNFKL